ncbi:hypothetical protein HY623_01350 [Candidatus Uhrbacteria bacterium]|nr:hypothetical protein [Candidatus Uhrbacteria bacterium]
MLHEPYSSSRGKSAYLLSALFVVLVGTAFLIVPNGAYAISAAPTLPAPVSGAPKALPADHLLDVLNKQTSTRAASDASAFSGTVKIGGATQAAKGILEIGDVGVTHDAFLLSVASGIASTGVGANNRKALVLQGGPTPKISAYDYVARAGMKLTINPDNSDVVIVPGGGRVGIGTIPTASSVGLLQIAKTNDRYSGITFNDSRLRLGSDPNGNGAIFAQGGGAILEVGAQGYISFTTGAIAGHATEKMRINEAGNVGIGTTEPGAALEVKRTVGNGNAEIFANYNGTNIGRLNAASNGNVYMGVSSGTGDLAIGVNDNVTALNILGKVIKREDNVEVGSIGNVGIGIAKPLAKLHIEGQSTWGGLTIKNKNNWYTHFNYPDDKNYIRGTTIIADNDANVKVGIGTSSPGYKLEVNGDIRTGAGGDIRLGPANSGTDAILYSDNGELSFYTNKDRRMVLDTSGRLGIGTPEPENKLEISGNNQAIALTTGGGEKNNLYGGRWRVHDTGNGVYTSFDTKNVNSWTNDRLTILSSNGNVGIGTTAPVVAGGGFTGIDIRGTNGSSVVLGKSGGSPTFLYSDSSYLNFETPGVIAFRPGGSEKMIITSDGKVGIGTTTPESKLHIQNVLEGNPADKSLFSIYDLHNQGRNGQYFRILGGTRGINLISNWTSLSFGARYDAGGEFKQDLTIDTNGKVGIGTTSPRVKLEVAGSVSTGLLAPRNTYLADTYPTFSGWSNTQTSTCGTWEMLGGFEILGGRDYVRKTIPNLPAGDYIVEFDFYKIDSWDGELAIFMWNDDRKWSRKYYSSEGTQICGQQHNNWNEDKAHVAVEVNQTETGNATLHFGATLDSHAGDESWGVNNIVVYKKGSTTTLAAIGDLKVNGNVGIGTSDPWAKLHIEGRDKWGGLAIVNANTHVTHFNYPDGKNYIRGTTIIADDGGNVGIGTTSPHSERKLHVMGTERIETAADAWNWLEIARGDDTIYFGSDVTNRGIWSNGRRGVGIYTNSYNRLYVRGDTGNVGIGTTVPNQKLEVKAGDGTNSLIYGLKLENVGAQDDGNGVATGILFGVSSSADSNRGKGGLVYAYPPSGGTWNRGDFYFLQNTDETSAVAGLSDAVMTIKNNGNVGIGTDPSSPFHILNSSGDMMRIQNSGGGEADIRYLTGSSSWEVGTNNVGNGTDKNQFYIYDASGVPNPYAFTVQRGTGNVGIGMTPLTEKLEVAGSIKANDHIESRWTSVVDTAYNANPRTYYTSRNMTMRTGLNEQYELGEIAVTSQHPLAFYANGYEHMRITVDGKVGIGTADPKEGLDVYGKRTVLRGGLYVGGNDNFNWISGFFSKPLAFFVRDNSGAFSEKMRILQNGYVGIGTDEPKTKLDVQGGDINVGYLGEKKKFADLSKHEKLAFETDRVGLDVAELFESEETVEVGDLLVVSATNERKLKKSSHSYQDTIVGVVSGSPALLFEGSELKLGAKPNRFEKGEKPPVALAGRIPVKVSLENGTIKPGDYLTTSSKPGVAMKATEPGMTIGVALESYDGEGDGKILVFLNLGEKNTSSVIKELQGLLKSLERRIRMMEYKPRW